MAFPCNWQEANMEILYPRCAGLDVHKASVSACVLTPGPEAEPNKQIEQFGTTTGELHRLRDWLVSNGVTHAAMESTGVYWKPVFNILESACKLILVNARHIKQVPGRKSDKADCAWIASLLRHGLLQASFVPDAEVRQLRDLCRMRTTLVRQCVQVGNRLRKVLEDANIKLDSVASDALGVSGRDMIGALMRGCQDPAELAELARGRLRAKMPELEQALEGRVTTHHRFLLRELMRELSFLEGQVARYEKQIDRHMRPFEWAAELLVTMPGVDRTAACALIAEIGVDMQRFATSRHLASWAGLCPGNNESAGKRRSGKSHRGSRWIKAVMTEIAWAASRTKDTYAQAQYRKLAKGRGKKRALVAVANSLLQAAWHMLGHRMQYKELGPDYLQGLNRHQLGRSLVRRLESLGHKVTLEPAA
jgi:transposase